VPAAILATVALLAQPVMTVALVAIALSLLAIGLLLPSEAVAATVEVTLQRLRVVVVVAA
jgi:hypothetical protein